MADLPSERLEDGPRPGWYRVIWVCDVEKVEAGAPAEAARIALEMLASPSELLANPFTVVDGDTGVSTEHDLSR